MLSRPERRAVANVLQGNTQSKWNSYYSHVRLESNAVTPTTGQTYTIGTGLLSRAFSYGIGGGMTSAGFINTTQNATYADTNIQTPNQTVAGENVLIRGIGLILAPNSDFHLAKMGMQAISVKAIVNSSLIFPLGTPDMLPGPGGLTGLADAPTVLSPIYSSLEFVGGITNGLPINMNFFSFPDPLIWRSAGNGDSGFNVEFRTERAIQSHVAYAITTRAAVTATASTAGVGAEVIPSSKPVTTANAGQPGVNIDYMVVLIGRTLNPLSDN